MDPNNNALVHWIVCVDAEYEMSSDKSDLDARSRIPIDSPSVESVTKQYTEQCSCTYRNFCPSRKGSMSKLGVLNFSEHAVSY